jgi:hypothetical protein
MTTESAALAPPFPVIASAAKQSTPLSVIGLAMTAERRGGVDCRVEDSSQ